MDKNNSENINMNSLGDDVPTIFNWNKVISLYRTRILHDVVQMTGIMEAGNKDLQISQNESKPIHILQMESSISKKLSI